VSAGQPVCTPGIRRIPRAGTFGRQCRPVGDPARIRAAVDGRQREDSGDRQQCHRPRPPGAGRGLPVTAMSGAASSGTTAAASCWRCRRRCWLPWLAPSPRCWPRATSPSAPETMAAAVSRTAHRHRHTLGLRVPGAAAAVRAAAARNVRARRLDPRQRLVLGHHRGCLPARGITPDRGRPGALHGTLRSGLPPLPRARAPRRQRSSLARRSRSACRCGPCTAPIAGRTQMRCSSWSRSGSWSSPTRWPSHSSTAARSSAAAWMDWRGRTLFRGRAITATARSMVSDLDRRPRLPFGVSTSVATFRPTRSRASACRMARVRALLLDDAEDAHV
jgi:hypothetical protein